MKTHKFLVASVLLLSAFCVSATNGKETDKKEPKSEPVQCGVNNSQIYNYLVNCSHHHSVGDITDIPGTCNSKAQIENCKTAIVVVVDGQIVSHSDQNGICNY